MEKVSGKAKAGDGTELFWRGWVPEAPEACLLFVHGLAEHSGRYERTASHFAGRGFPSYAVDLRGHGMSEGRRAHVAGFGDYLSDVDAALAVVRERHPSLPRFLVGHSLGGLVVIRHALEKPGEVEGVVVSSPLLAIHPSSDPPAAKKALARMLSGIVPGLLLPTNLDPATLSKDRAVVDAYMADPLVSHKASVRLFTSLQAAMAEARAGASSLKVPMLLMQSGSDLLVDPEATRLWAAAAPPDLVEFVWWEGFYHEMLNEPERGRVYERVAVWLGRTHP